MQIFLTRFFQARLTQAGFPVELEEIEWSLSCCQGDGVAFKCNLDADDMKKVLVGVYPKYGSTASERIKNLMGRNASLKRVKEADASFQIIRTDTRYPNSTAMECEFEIGVEPDDMDEFQKLSDELCELCVVIIAYARELCSELEKKGYEILSSAPSYRHDDYYESGGKGVGSVIKKIKTQNYLVEVSELDDEMYLDAEEGEDDIVLQTAQAIVEGKHRTVSLDVKIKTRDPDHHLYDDDEYDDEAYSNVIGRSFLGNVSYEPSDKTYGGYLREQVSEAIAEARASVKIVKKPRNPPELPELQLAS